MPLSQNTAEQGRAGRDRAGQQRAGQATPGHGSEGAPLLGRQRAFDRAFLILAAIASAAALAVAWREGPWRVVEIAAQYLGFLALLSPKILCGFFIAAAVPILIPRAVFTRWLGQDSGPRGLAVASVAGALVPGGPMMIFPLAVGFRTAGAPPSVLITFLTAWSLFSLTKIVAEEMALLGPGFIARPIAVTFPIPLVVGGSPCSFRDNPTKPGMFVLEMKGVCPDAMLLAQAPKRLGG